MTLNELMIDLAEIIRENPSALDMKVILVDTRSGVMEEISSSDISEFEEDDVDIVCDEDEVGQEFLAIYL